MSWRSTMILVVWAVGIAPLLMLPGRATAQSGSGGVIRGRVVAADTDEPLAAASVVARTGRDTVTAAMTDAVGRFLLTGLRPGQYTIEVGFLGHAAATRTVTLPGDGSIDLGTLRIAPVAIQLEAVTVATERPAAVFAPDRDIYSTESLPAAAGGVATEVLSSIPELEVDFDGTITLRGSSPQIYLNGRPAPMSGEALAVFLQQFPADRIERIEVITNPSARFDAAGAGGIINIVLKEGAELGTSGSAYANADSRGEAGAGGRVAWQRGALMLHGNAFLRRSDRETTGYDHRQNLTVDPPTYVRQDSWSRRHGLSGSTDATAELRLGERSTLRAEGRFSDFGSDADATTTTTHMDAAEAWTRRYERISAAESVRRSADVSLGFIHEFEKRRHTLELRAELDSERNDDEDRIETEFDLIGDDGAPIPADLTLQDVDEREREATLRVDYVRPWGEATQLELGFRISREVRENRRIREQYGADDEGRTGEITRRGFDHRETRNAAYMTVARRLGRLGLQLGTRVQITRLRYELPSGEAFEKNDINFFPSAHLSYQLDGGHRLRFSYSRRVRRPPPSRLNPVDLSTDPLNRRIGNPDLEPQYTHSFGLDASTSTPWGTLRFSPYYRRITNDWASIRRVDENGVSTTTWENVATRDIYGASLTASVRRARGWGGNISLSGHQEDRDASNLRSDLSGRSLRWSIRGNVSGRIASTLGVRANLSYTPAHAVPQGRVSSRLDSSIGLRYQLLDGRARLNLTARDPFDISRTTVESRDPTFIQLGRSRISRRSLSLGVAYDFGGGR